MKKNTAICSVLALLVGILISQIILICLQIQQNQKIEMIDQSARLGWYNVKIR